MFATPEWHWVANNDKSGDEKIEAQASELRQNKGMIPKALDFFLPFQKDN